MLLKITLLFIFLYLFPKNWSFLVGSLFFTGFRALAADLDFRFQPKSWQILDFVLFAILIFVIVLIFVQLFVFDIFFGFIK